MITTIALNSEYLHNLDLFPAATVIENLLQENSGTWDKTPSGAITSYEQQLRFEIDYPREPEDPRELSEIPEIRLWFIRLDAHYPWLPFCWTGKVGTLPLHSNVSAAPIQC